MDMTEWRDLSRKEQARWVQSAGAGELQDLLGEMLVEEAEEGFDAAELHDMLMNGTKGVRDMTVDELRDELGGYMNDRPDPERRRIPREDSDGEEEAGSGHEAWKRDSHS